MFNQPYFRQKGITPPSVRRESYLHHYHGSDILDEYHWLKHKENPEVLDYLKAENIYTDQVMTETKELQETLYYEMKGRIKETDLSVPECKDDFYYYSRTEAGKQYAIYCRKKYDGPEQIILDENILAEGCNFFSLGVFDVSPDHKILAYATNTTGDETYTLYFKNLETGELLADKVDAIAASFIWANDNSTYFYATLDHTKRPDKIFMSRLGSTDRALVYEEIDQKFNVHLGKTRDEKFLLIASESKNSSEVQYLSADLSDGAWQVFDQRRTGIEYSIDHHDTGFYVLTNDEALNFKILFVPDPHIQRSSWTEFVKHDSVRVLDDVNCFEKFIVLHGKECGVPFIELYDIAKKSWHGIQFTEPIFALTPAGNPEYKTEKLRFIYSSLVTPTSVYEYNMQAGEQKLLKQQEVIGGHNPADYTLERLYATASDGTQIPISLFYKNSIFKKDGSAPCYLYAYGSYGISYSTWFSSSRLSLADRGFVVAFASPRGGGELGRQWYYDGKFIKKKNTFTDFISCAEFLIKERYTSESKLAICGGSAGGLLMGAVTNMRPELFHTIIAHVPFVDVVNTMMDADLPLTIGEYEEWGDPHEKEFFDSMRAYSPYDNVEEKNYPNLFVFGGLNDPRVAFWEPAKWVAKLRQVKQDDHLLLFKTYMGAGHGGPSGRYDALHEQALEYAFILKTLQ